MNIRRLYVLSLLALLCVGLPYEVPGRGSEPLTAHAPALKRFCTIDRMGESIIPNGRILTPTGRQVQVAPHPYGLCLSPDGNTLVTANSGTRPFSLSIIKNLDNYEPDVQQIPPGYETNEGILNAVFMGLAIAPDNRTLYASGGDDGFVLIFDLESGERKGEISADCVIGDASFEDSYLGDLTLSRDGSTIYVVDQANFRLVMIDTASNEVVESVRVGRYPFGVCLSPDERRAYVANVGMFEYSLVEGLDPDRVNETGIAFPPFAFGSEEARDGVVVDGKRVPGLGDPNAPESFSVWAVDITRRGRAKVVAKVKTGILVGEVIEGIPAVGGSSPNSLVVDEEYVYVSNGTNDSISVIDQVTHVVVDTIQLTLSPETSHLRGIIPFGLAIDPARKRLYVAEAGINAVAIIDTRTRDVLGHIPMGWFPSKLELSPNGRRLYVANAKGLGSGPNAGPNFVLTPAGTNVGRLMRGVVSIMTIPPDNVLPFETQKVIRNNVTFAASRPWLSEEEEKENRNPVPPYPGAYKSPIQHIVFITKENRTFDEVFGECPRAISHPPLARFGVNAEVRSREREEVVPGVDVM
ncbi:MAG: bifunctional YncE family protein/alkaline phosphatase family protein, partial [bacterium]